MKWEYHLVPLPGELNRTSILDYLNKLGSESWELVSVDNGIAYFKRATEEVAEMTQRKFDTKIAESMNRLFR